MDIQSERAAWIVGVRGSEGETPAPFMAYAVTMDDQEAAKKAVREKRNRPDEQLDIVGQLSRDTCDRLGLPVGTAYPL